MAWTTTLRHLLHLPDPPQFPVLPLVAPDEINDLKGRARQASAKLEASTRQMDRQAVKNIASAEANIDAISKLVEAMAKKVEKK